MRVVRCLLLRPLLNPHLKRRFPLRKPFATEVPWSFGFQCNERYLKWDRSAQSQLVKLVVMDKLRLTQEELQSRLIELNAVLPDIGERLDTISVDLLIDLAQDTGSTADKVLAIKMALPSMNVASAIRRYPELIAKHSKEALLKDIDRWMMALDGDRNRVGSLLSKEPRCLKVTLNDAIREVQRLMPNCRNPIDVFENDPSSFLSMEQLGLESSN